MGRIGPGATARCLVATTSGLWVGEVITRCASLKAGDLNTDWLSQSANSMEQVEQYQGYIIRAFEQRLGSWLAEIRKQDGSVIVRKGQRPREFVTTPSTRYSAADAIAFAKEAIDSSVMQGDALTSDRARLIASNMAQLADLLKREK